MTHHWFDKRVIQVSFCPSVIKEMVGNVLELWLNGEGVLFVGCSANASQESRKAWDSLIFHPVTLEKLQGVYVGSGGLQGAGVIVVSKDGIWRKKQIAHLVLSSPYISSAGALNVIIRHCRGN